uniref:Uncharacterized protein TCIL3000_11_15880 n=1 Tax=Trypanosoma congolense (strain IL3000) TaxID=1068625 RepID=G0V355_TRYCI|nr:unnamed protein product [Trypanosoma congolense IL3000]
MEALLRSVEKLLEQMYRGDSGNVGVGHEFKQKIKRTQTSVSKWSSGAWVSERMRVVNADVMSVVLSALYFKKTRVVEAALPVIQGMLHKSCIPFSAQVVLHRGNGGNITLPCGAALFEALRDLLLRVTDSGLQLSSVEILHDLVSDDTFPSFTGRCVTRCVQTCCRMVLHGLDDGARAISSDLLPLCILRVTRAFLESAQSDSDACTFTSSTLLDDYMHDVERGAKHVPIKVEGVSDCLMDASLRELPLDDKTVQFFSQTADGDTTLSTFSSFDYFRSTLNDQIMRSALSSMRMGKFPDAMRDLLLLIKHTCDLGSRSVNEGSLEVRARQLALNMLLVVFEALPVANCSREHPCATWLSLVITASKYDLIRCIGRNLTTVSPASFFTSAVRILSLLLQKCHYHLARELHTLLAVVVFPLAQSRYSSFSQKHAVVDMVRELLDVPHLCISFFINYDCNPTFDAAGKYGGMLELIVNFIAEMTYTRLIEPDWLTDDQQQLLRSGCASAIHNLVQSLQRWITEDPEEYSHQQTREVMSQVLTRLSGDKVVGSHWCEVYRNCWGKDVKDRYRSSDKCASSQTPVTPVVIDESLLDQPDFERYWGVGYHWKHIHYLLHSKHMAQHAARLINKGKWRDAMKFLKEREYIPSTNENECWSAFALFLKTHEGVERGALCGIFERILKDKDCDRVLKEYLQHFFYKDVPIDIALRDTTCEFMSWDRPTFEAQVWVMIQQRFGEVYASQNPRNITAEDANAMAGVLLFLHTSLHNAHVRSSRMTMKDFVRNGNECVSVPFPEDVMREMYTRVAQQKWELDKFHRTPRQVELEMATPGIAKIVCMYQQQKQQLASSGDQASTAGETTTDVADTTAMSYSYNSHKTAALQSSVPLDGDGDSSLLDAPMLPYTEGSDVVKCRESYHQRYLDLALRLLQRLECEHRVLYADRGGVQPYAVPHYAQHVRPMLLNLYPQILATVYKGFRVVEVQPILRLLHDTYRMLDDLVAAFAVDLMGLHAEAEKMIQHYMKGETQRFSPPTRASFTLPLMNMI